MNRQDFLNKQWKPYPDGSLISEGLSCFRFQSHDEESLSSEEVLEDSKLGPSCPVSFLIPGDWVAWCESRKVYFLLSPKLSEAPVTNTRDPLKWNRFLNQVRDFFRKNEFDEILTPLLVDSPGVDHHIDYFKVP